MLPTGDPLGTVVTMLATPFGRLDGLAIDTAGAGGWRPTGSPPDSPSEGVIDGLPGSVSFPRRKVVVDGPPWGKIVGQRSPDTAIAVAVEDGINHGSHLGLAWPPTGAGRRQEGLQDSPLLACQITGVWLRVHTLSTFETPLLEQTLSARAVSGPSFHLATEPQLLRKSEEAYLQMLHMWLKRKSIRSVCISDRTESLRGSHCPLRATRPRDPLDTGGQAKPGARQPNGPVRSRRGSAESCTRIPARNHPGGSNSGRDNGSVSDRDRQNAGGFSFDGLLLRRRGAAGPISLPFVHQRVCRLRWHTDFSLQSGQSGER